MATVRRETTLPVAVRRLRTEQAVSAVLDPPDPPSALSSTVATVMAGNRAWTAEATRSCPRRDDGGTRTERGSR